MITIGGTYGGPMGPELRHLRYFLAVAEHANFTRAAEALRVSQPTLSQQIKQLENAVGAQLLERSGRSARLTDAGEIYVQHARAALDELASGGRAVADVQDLSRGHLRLSVMPTFTGYLVGPVVGEFAEQHPGVSVDVREEPQNRIEAALLAGESDVGIGFGGAHLPGVESAELFQESLSLVVGPRHPRARRRRALPAAEVADQQLVLLSGDFATRGDIDIYFAAHGVRTRIAVEANSVVALTEAVRRTTLAAVLPDAITGKHPDLRPIPLEPAMPARTVCLLRREAAHRSAAGREFERVLRQRVPTER